MYLRRIAARLLILSLLITTISPNLNGYHVNTHAALSYWAVTRPDSGVERFLQEELLLRRGLLTPSFAFEIERTLAQWVQIGSERVDNYILPPLGRFVNHFYNPVNQQGLNDLIGNIQTGQRPNSLNWAWNRQDDPTNGDWSWQEARQLYFRMLTSFYEKRPASIPGQIGRDEYAGKMFKALGHVIHLIQDATQPQHTRNDAHTPLEGAPFEDFCSDNYGSIPSVGGFVNEPFPQFNYNNLPLNGPSGIPRELMAFWDTRQYRGQQSWSYTGALGAAEFSNTHFVTDDTIFTGQNGTSYPGGTVALLGSINSQHVFPFPRLRIPTLPHN